MTTLVREQEQASIPTHSVTSRLVHKLDPSEALLTHWRTPAPDTFEVTAAWPETHPFYTSPDGAYAPLLVSETVRQLFPLLSHAGYDVPEGHHLVWETYECSVTPEALRPGPTLPQLRVGCHDLVRRRTGVAALTMDVELVRDGAAVAHARSRFTIQAPAVYTRLRGELAGDHGAMTTAPKPPAPIPATEVGSHRPEDVFLAEPEDTAPQDAEPQGTSPQEAAPQGAAPKDTGPHLWQLRVDPTHPQFFDHPVDHIPGLLLLEAARQAAHFMGRPALSLETSFHRYVEFATPCWIEAEAVDARTVRVIARQDGELKFTADVR